MIDKLTAPELPKIIKRLELIKNLIFLEEDENIEEQIIKLKQLHISQNVEKIIIDLQQKSFGEAIKNIEEFLNSHHQISVFIDPEIEALRFEAKALEKKLQKLSNEKAEIEKLVHEFGVRHNQILGELILKILKHLKEKSKGGPKEAESEKDYEDFNSNYQMKKDEKIIALTQDEQKELKDCYRKASKLCHPDMVEENQQLAAQKIFMELNAAYESNDLKRAKEILKSLQQDKMFTSKTDTANEKLTLVTELNRLRVRLNDLNNEIADIKASDIYSEIISITNWDEYFIKTKRKLQEQLSQLQNDSE